MLVTGASGFIGSHVVARLVERGCEVFVLDRSPFRGPLDTGVTFLPVDITDREQVRLAMSVPAPDVIVHLAALHFIPYCDEHPAETRATNVRGTANLLDAVGGRPVRFVFASTAAVYQETHVPHREEDGLRPTDVYGRTKLEAERLIGRHNRSRGSSEAIVRIFNVYGPGATHPHLIPTVVSQALHGDIVRVGNLAPRRDYVYVDDVATALIALALDVDGNVTVNLGTGRSASVADIVRLVSDLFGRRLELISDPTRIRSRDRLHLTADIGRLSKVLSWAPATTLEQGIEKLLPAERTTR